MIIIIMIIMDIVNIYHDDNRDNFDDIAATSQKKTVLKRKKGKHREVFDEGINLCCQTQTYDWSHLLSKVTFALTGQGEQIQPKLEREVLVVQFWIQGVCGHHYHHHHHHRHHRHRHHHHHHHRTWWHSFGFREFESRRGLSLPTQSAR